MPTRRCCASPCGASSPTRRRSPTCATRYENDAPTLGHDDVWTGLRDIGAIGLLVPEAHGGAGMGMVDAAVVLEELGSGDLPGALRVHRRSARCRSSSRPARPRARVPAARVWPTGRPSARSRCSRPAVATAGDRRRAPRAPTARCGSSTARRCTSPTATPRTFSSRPRATATACSACSRCAATTPVVTSTPTPTVDGSRKEATVTFSGARGVAPRIRRRERRGRPHPRPARGRVRSRRRGRGRAGVAARGRVRQGARAVRQADRFVPSGAASVRRHAARARARARRRLLRVLGRRRRRARRKRTARL